MLSKICQQGFDDARQFLQNNNLVGCDRCLLSTGSLRKVSTRVIMSNPRPPSPAASSSKCDECETQRKVSQLWWWNFSEICLFESDFNSMCLFRQMVLVDRLPETVTLTLQNAIEAANNGLMNWIFRHRGLRLLSILTLPYVLPADVAYATFLKYMTDYHCYWSLVAAVPKPLTFGLKAGDLIVKVVCFHSGRNKVTDYSRFSLFLFLGLPLYWIAGSWTALRRSVDSWNCWETAWLRTSSVWSSMHWKSAHLSTPSWPVNSP